MKQVRYLVAVATLVAATATLSTAGADHDCDVLEGKWRSSASGVTMTVLYDLRECEPIYGPAGTITAYARLERSDEPETRTEAAKTCLPGNPCSISVSVGGHNAIERTAFYTWHYDFETEGPYWARGWGTQICNYLVVRGYCGGEFQYATEFAGDVVAATAAAPSP